jgi:hypothetical protein
MQIPAPLLQYTLFSATATASAVFHERWSRHVPTGICPAAENKQQKAKAGTENIRPSQKLNILQQFNRVKALSNRPINNFRFKNRKIIRCFNYQDANVAIFLYNPLKNGINKDGVNFIKTKIAFKKYRKCFIPLDKFSANCG